MGRRRPVEELDGYEAAPATMETAGVGGNEYFDKVSSASPHVVDRISFSFVSLCCLGYVV